MADTGETPPTHDATYRGDPAVGGPAQTRRTDDLTITKIAVGEYNNNSYLLRCRATNAALLIDAAAEADRLLHLLGDTEPSAARLTGVLTTHSHADHWQALNEVVTATGATTYAGRIDAPDIPVTTQHLLDDDDTIKVGDVSLRMIHLVGHTPGSIAVVYSEPQGRSHIFTGDCLFPGGVGKTWDDPARFDQLLTGVTDRIFTPYPDDTWIYPGHGVDTTLGVERPELPAWRERGW